MQLMQTNERFRIICYSNDYRAAVEYTRKHDITPADMQYIEDSDADQVLAAVLAAGAIKNDAVVARWHPREYFSRIYAQQPDINPVDRYIRARNKAIAKFCTDALGCTFSAVITSGSGNGGGSGNSGSSGNELVISCTQSAAIQ